MTLKGFIIIIIIILKSTAAVVRKRTYTWDKLKSAYLSLIITDLPIPIKCKSEGF